MSISAFLRINLSVLLSSRELLIYTIVTNANSKEVTRKVNAVVQDQKIDVLRGSIPFGARLVVGIRSRCSFVSKTRCNKRNGNKTGASTKTRNMLKKRAIGMTMMNMRVSLGSSDWLFCSLSSSWSAFSHTFANQSHVIFNSTKSKLISPN